MNILAWIPPFILWSASPFILVRNGSAGWRHLAWCGLAGLILDVLGVRITLRWVFPKLLEGWTSFGPIGVAMAIMTTCTVIAVLWVVTSCLSAVLWERNAPAETVIASRQTTAATALGFAHVRHAPAASAQWPPAASRRRSPYGYQPYNPGRSAEHPQGTTILVLGILSIVVCGLLAPVAWGMGNKATPRDRRRPDGHLQQPELRRGRTHLRHGRHCPDRARRAADDHRRARRCRRPLTFQPGIGCVRKEFERA